MLFPAFSVTVSVSFAQVSQLPVPAHEIFLILVPLTYNPVLVLIPFPAEYLSVRVVLPAVAADTVKDTWAVELL